MKQPRVLHPLLFALAPTLFLYSRNADAFPVSVVLVPVVAALAIVGVLWLVLRRFIRDRLKAGAFLSLIVFTFVVYGHIHNLLDATFDTAAAAWQAQRMMFYIWPVLFIVAAFFCLRSKRSFVNLTRLLNVAAAVLVMLPLAGLLMIVVRGTPTNEASSGPTEYATQATPSDTPTGERLPDIYYIILDGFGGSEVLGRLYDYPDPALARHLTSRGFYVAGRATANYTQTLLSLSSSLNSRYINDVTRRFEGETTRIPLDDMIRNSHAVHFLRQRGYRIAAFSIGGAQGELATADTLLAPPRDEFHLTEFQSELLATTAFPATVGRLKKIRGARRWLGNMLAGGHRRRLLYTFHKLPHVAAGDRPTFVYAHILAPHPPFVFDRHGNQVDYAEIHTLRDGANIHNMRPELQAQYVERYREQLMYIEKRIAAAVDSILARARHRRVPPIIVIQGDHGPASRVDGDRLDRTDIAERLSILNAYHLPKGGDSLLYDDITPVNTFRVIFNHYFGADFPLLPDRCYFARWSDPYSFIDVTDRVRPPRVAP